MKKILTRLSILLVLVLGSLIWFYTSATYSDGFRTGTVVKVSKRGVIFKTIEGQLNVNTFGSLKGQSQFNEAFEFSVAHKNEHLLDSLRIASSEGKRVTLYYHEKYKKLFWRGDTKYFVYKIESK